LSMRSMSSNPVNVAVAGNKLRTLAQQDRARTISATEDYHRCVCGRRLPKCPLSPKSVRVAWGASNQQTKETRSSVSARRWGPSQNKTRPAQRRARRDRPGSSEPQPKESQKKNSGTEKSGGQIAKRGRGSPAGNAAPPTARKKRAAAFTGFQSRGAAAAGANTNRRAEITSEEGNTKASIAPANPGGDRETQENARGSVRPTGIKKRRGNGPSSRKQDRVHGSRPPKEKKKKALIFKVQ